MLEGTLTAASKDDGLKAQRGGQRLPQAWPLRNGACCASGCYHLYPNVLRHNWVPITVKESVLISLS
jgi:hypothetical protein